MHSYQCVGGGKRGTGGDPARCSEGHCAATDKAANPINLYGASKLAADKIFVAANNLSGENGCRFSVVRYGNVLDSRGGVLRLFRRLMENSDAPLPITDERMTRLWISRQQAVNFVLSSFALMRGGELFVPKIPSMHIVDFARAVAPGRDLQIIGIRPGEKLHEIMISEDEARSAFEIDDRYVMTPAFAWWGRDRTDFDNARKLEDGFRYASDNNPEWLTNETLQHILGQDAGRSSSGG